MTTLTQASHQWATRPADERFLSLTDLQEHMHSVRDRSRGRVVSTRRIEAVPVENDPKGLALLVNDEPSLATNWSFQQVAQRADAPASYLKKLRSDLAADCINYGLKRRNVEDVGTLIRVGDPGSPVATLAAATGPNYGRVWNADIVDALISRFGDGRTGTFTVPGEFGKEVAITKQNTTIYGSDRDMFVFLADEKNRVEVPNRRDGKPGSLARGFFVGNSEVGSATLSVVGFLYDYVCMNRIVWGAEEIKQISIRHTSGAPDRFVEEIAPALLAYSQSSSLNIEQAIARAQAARIDEVDDFLNDRFTRSQAKAIKLVHEAEENRPIETLWDASTAITAYAKGIEYQDERIVFERVGGKVLSLAK